MEKTFRKLPTKKQLAILNAATKVFAQKGYHHANVAAICKQARISNGALYKYFKNKEALFFSVIDFMTETMVSSLFIKHVGSNASVHDTVCTVFKDLVDLAATQSEMLAIYTDIASCSMNKLSPVVSGKIEGEARRFWAELVRKGKERGEVKEVISEEGAAFFIDNHFSLLAYSLVSKHFETRFRLYFGGKDKEVPHDEKVRILMRSIRMILN
jgi:AcrR family transcriptional regulator